MILTSSTQPWYNPQTPAAATCDCGASNEPLGRWSHLQSAAYLTWTLCTHIHTKIIHHVTVSSSHDPPARFCSHTSKPQWDINCQFTAFRTVVLKVSPLNIYKGLHGFSSFITFTLILSITTCDYISNTVCYYYRCNRVILFINYVYYKYDS